MLRLTDITAITEGVKSEVVKHQQTGFLQSLRAFKGATSGIKSLDQACCLTILGQQRSLDLQVPHALGHAPPTRRATLRATRTSSPALVAA